MRRTFGILCVAAPFIAAAIAGGGPRRDLRIAAMAIVSAVMVWLVFRLTGRSFRSAVLSFGLAAPSAAGAALIAGARAPFGVIAVAVVVAAFATIGQLLLRSRPEAPQH